MNKIGIFWLREDFRIENNQALSFATQNHQIVSALYIFNQKNFSKKKEAQQWWICLLYTSPSPRDATLSRMPSSA